MMMGTICLSFSLSHRLRIVIAMIFFLESSKTSIFPILPLPASQVPIRLSIASVVVSYVTLGSDLFHAFSI